MNTNKKATGSSSKRLLAALAVLAVAFVVLAAVPAVATDSDAASVSLDYTSNTVNASAGVGQDDIESSTDSSTWSYDNGTGIVTLSGNTAWALKEDITIKGLVMGDHSLTISSYSDSSVKSSAVSAKYTLTIKNDVTNKDYKVVYLLSATASAVLELDGANLSIVDAYAGSMTYYNSADNEKAQKTSPLNRINVPSPFHVVADDASITMTSSCTGAKFNNGSKTIFHLTDSAVTMDLASGFSGGNYFFMDNSTVKADGSSATDLTGYFDMKGGSSLTGGHIGIYSAALVDSTIDADAIGFWGKTITLDNEFTGTTNNANVIANNVSVDKDSSIRAGVFSTILGEGYTAKTQGTASASLDAVKFVGQGSVTADLQFTSLDGEVENTKAGFSFSGVTFNGTASYTTGGITSTANLTNVVGSTESGKSLVVSAGSIELKGTIATQTAEQSIVVTGDAKIDGTLTVPENVTITVSEGSTLTIPAGSALALKTGTSQLVVEDGASVIVEAADPSSSSPSSDGKITVNGASTFIEDSVYIKNNYNYTVKTIALGGKTVAVGVVIDPVPYSSKKVDDTKIVPNTIVIDEAGYTDPSVNFNGFTIVPNEDGSDAVYIEPGTYPNAVRAQISASAGNVAASKYVYIDLEITKVALTTDMVSFESLVYTGGVLTPVVKLSTGYDLDIADLEITYTDGTSGASAVAGTSTSAALPALSKGTVVSVDGYKTKQIVNAGSYTATIVVKDDAKYYTDGKDGSLKFEDKVLVYPATPEVTATQNNIWNSEDYVEESVTYSVTLNGGKIAVADQGTVTLKLSKESIAAADKTLSLKMTAVSYEEYIITSQDDLDNYLAKWAKTNKDDKGFIFYLQISVAAPTSNNLVAEVSQVYTFQVGAFQTLKDYIAFSGTVSGTSDYIGGESGAIAHEKNTFDVEVAGVLTKDAATKTYSFSLVFTPTNADRVTLQIATKGAAGYTTLVSPDKNVVIGDLTAAGGVVTAPITIKAELAVSTVLTLSIIGDETKGYADATYSIDLSGIAPSTFRIVFTDGDNVITYTNDRTDRANANGYVNFVTGSYFNVPGTYASDSWTLVTTEQIYRSGAVYIVEASDIKSGVITFVATVPAEPEAGQVLDIVSVGYAAENANDTINAALDAAGYKGDAVTDADPAAVMYIVFTMTTDGRIHFTVGDDSKDFDFKAGVHAIYWTTEGYVAGQTVDIAIVDGDVSAEIGFAYVPAATVEPEPVEPTETVYTVFFILDGKQTSETYTAGAVVEFPATENVAWTCNGVAVDVSEEITAIADAVYIGITASEAPTYSTDLAVSAKLVDGKFRFVIAGYDGGDIKEGGVSITYTYKPASGGRNVTATIDASQITVEYDGSIAYGVVDMPAGQDVIRFTATYTYELDGTSYSESSSTVYVGA